MIGESADASSAPWVSFSTRNARSGGQSSASRSCDKRPFDTSSLLLRSVKDRAPSRLRYSLSVMEHGLDYLNLFAQAESLAWQNDFNGGDGYGRRMAAPRLDWYLSEWLRATGKKQSDIVKDLDWNKAKVSLMVRGLQPYTREEVNELATYLQIDPHELLMHPERAHRIRRLQADMIRLVHDAETEEAEKPVKKVSLN
jgi:hypothetical protein